MAQFCAIIGVSVKNGTEFSIRGEGGALAVKIERASSSAVLGSSVPKSKKSIPVAQFCAIIVDSAKNGTEFSIRGEGGALAVSFERAPPSQALCQNRGNRFLWHNFVP